MKLNVSVPYAHLSRSSGKRILDRTKNDFKTDEKEKKKV